MTDIMYKQTKMLTMHTRDDYYILIYHKKHIMLSYLYNSV